MADKNIALDTELENKEVAKNKKCKVVWKYDDEWGCCWPEVILVADNDSE